MIWIVVLSIIGYLCGSIPFGIVIGKKIKGIDLRTVGSGNIGTANAIRALGFFWGGMVFLCDVLKGAFPVLLAIGLTKWMPGAVPQYLYHFTFALAGFCAVIGHNHSIFLNFGGGKGIATSFGMFLVLNPVAALIAFGVWFVVVAASRLSSAGSLAGSLALPILFFLFKSPLEYVIFAAVACIFAFYKHRENIGRLLRGEERKFGEKALPREPGEKMETTAEPASTD